MKSGKLAGAALAGALSLSACAAESTNSTSENRSAVQQFEQCVGEYFSDQKAEVADNYLDAAERLASRLDDSEAIAVVEFLRSEAATAIGNEAGKETKIVVVDESANLYCSDLGRLFNASGFGTFNHATQDIFILEKDQHISADWAALLLLHEGRHAKNYFSGVHDELEERNTRIFEQRLLLEMGGGAYQELLNSIKDEIRQQPAFNAQNSYQIHTVPIPQQSIDAIFGASKSYDEYRIRRSSIYLHAVFQLLNEVFFDVSPDELARYQQNVIKPASL